MVQIKRKLGLSEVPSVIQARIFGAKGMWINDGAPVDPDGEAPEILLKISESQRKVFQSLEDNEDSNNPERLTVALVSFSRPARPSTLYQDFLPILIDRGVPWSNISQLIHKAADIGHNDLVSAVTYVIIGYIFKIRHISSAAKQQISKMWTKTSPKLRNREWRKPLKLASSL